LIETFRSSAISVIVYPVMFILSRYSNEKSTKYSTKTTFYYTSVRRNSQIFFIFLKIFDKPIDIMLFMYYIYNKGTEASNANTDR
jgi:hypothetical protein